MASVTQTEHRARTVTPQDIPPVDDTPFYTQAPQSGHTSTEVASQALPTLRRSPSRTRRLLSQGVLTPPKTKSISESRSPIDEPPGQHLAQSPPHSTANCETPSQHRTGALDTGAESTDPQSHVSDILNHSTAQTGQSKSTILRRRTKGR